jgi:hypothetical protein
MSNPLIDRRIVHRDDIRRTIEAQQKGIETGRAYNIGSRHRRADGAPDPSCSVTGLIRT